MSRTTVSSWHIIRTQTPLCIVLHCVNMIHQLSSNVCTVRAHTHIISALYAPHNILSPTDPWTMLIAKIYHPLESLVILSYCFVSCFFGRKENVFLFCIDMIHTVLTVDHCSRFYLLFWVRFLFSVLILSHLSFIISLVVQLICCKFICGFENNFQQPSKEIRLKNMES